VARELLQGGDLAGAAARLRELAPDDPVFSRAPPALDRNAVLAHLSVWSNDTSWYGSCIR
jgi:ATP-dependent helicase HepA